MKVIKYDSDGWLKQSIIKNNMSEKDAERGLPLNPPDIRELDWEEIKRELNNLMIERGLIALKDLNQRNGYQLLVSAVQSVITKKIVQLYKVGGKNGK